MYALFKSVLEQDDTPIVLCDLAHTVVYMNPVAMTHYNAYGGAELVGKSLLHCHNSASCARIEQVVKWFAESKDHNRVYTYRNDVENKDVYMIALRDEDGTLIGYYEKHAYRTAEATARYAFSDTPAE